MKIYKYRSSDDPYLETMLSSEQFHFSAWDQMNDPMEGYFQYYDNQVTEEELSSLVDGKSQIRICCFSMNPDVMLMWSHYSNNHKGVCIEIDTNFDVSGEVTYELVKYAHNINFVKNEYGKLRTAKSLLSYKLSAWCYEKEIRAFVQSPSRSLKVGKITKVILGINSSGDTEKMVKRAMPQCNVSRAKFDFDLSEIVVP